MICSVALRNTIADKHNRSKQNALSFFWNQSNALLSLKHASWKKSIKKAINERKSEESTVNVERWQSGRMQHTANVLSLKRVPRVRIPPSPPAH